MWSFFLFFLEIDSLWLWTVMKTSFINQNNICSKFTSNIWKEKKMPSVEKLSLKRANTSINWPNLSVNQNYWCITAARAQKTAHSSHLFMVYSLLPVMKLECCSGISHYSSQMVFDLQGFTRVFFSSLFCFWKGCWAFYFPFEGWSYASDIQLKMHESSDPDSMHFSPIPFLFERPLP